MKKTIALVLAAMLTLGLAGCGKNSTVTDKSESNKVIEENKDTNKETEANKTAEESKEKNTTSAESKEENKSTGNVKSTTNTSSESILTKEFKEVNSIEITYAGSTKKYSIEKDKEYIKKVYDSIVGTKTTVKNDRDESESKFTVNVIYKSGDKDVIQSTETGQFIYRVFGSKKSRVGGTNNTLISLVKESVK